MSSDQSQSTHISIDELLEQFSNGSSRKRRSLIQAVESRSKEILSLGMDALSPFDPEGDDWAAGWILQVLKRHHPEALLKHFPDLSGWFKAHSEVSVDYSSFQEALLSQSFEEADRITSSTLRKFLQIFHGAHHH